MSPAYEPRSPIFPAEHGAETAAVPSPMLAELYGHDPSEEDEINRMPFIRHDVDGLEALPTSGTGDDVVVKFQLIPISELHGKPAVGEVVERCLKERETIKIGRQVVRDGQATIKGTRKATELDVWFISKVVSRLHAEIWLKGGQVF